MHQKKKPPGGVGTTSSGEEALVKLRESKVAVQFEIAKPSGAYTEVHVNLDLTVISTHIPMGFTFTALMLA